MTSEVIRSVFLSSANETNVVAKALRLWLPCFSSKLQPWCSIDLKAGKLWSTALAAKLKATDVGIVCVSPRNCDAPWVNFEAGALFRSIDDTRVIPYLVGGEDFLKDPLHQFQAISATKAGTLRLVTRLLELVDRDAKVDLRMFAAFWPVLEPVVSHESSEPRDHDKWLAPIENLHAARTSLVLRDVTAPISAWPGATIPLRYQIQSEAELITLWLGASLKCGHNNIINRDEDQPADVRYGSHDYDRTLTIPRGTPPGEYRLDAEVWFGPKSDSGRSFPLSAKWPAQPSIQIRES